MQDKDFVENRRSNFYILKKGFDDILDKRKLLNNSVNYAYDNNKNQYFEYGDYKAQNLRYQSNTKRIKSNRGITSNTIQNKELWKIKTNNRFNETPGKSVKRREINKLEPLSNNKTIKEKIKLVEIVKMLKPLNETELDGVIDYLKSQKKSKDDVDKNTDDININIKETKKEKEEDEKSYISQESTQDLLLLI